MAEFAPRRHLKVHYQLPGTRYPQGDDGSEINGFHAELRRQVAALPGVQAAALAARHPLDPGVTNSFTIVGREAESAEWPEIRTRFISPGYVETLDVPLLAGRALGETDVAGTLINRVGAERYFSRANDQSWRSVLAMRSARVPHRDRRIR